MPWHAFLEMKILSVFTEGMGRVTRKPEGNPNIVHHIKPTSLQAVVLQQWFLNMIWNGPKHQFVLVNAFE